MSEINITNMIIPSTSTNDSLPKKYDPKTDYADKNSQLLDSINESMEVLKGISLETSLCKMELGNYMKKLKLKNDNETHKKIEPTKLIMSKLKKLYKIKGEKRLRRCNKNLDKGLDCPFEGCTKSYASRSSLKLHIKMNHDLNDKKKAEAKDQISNLLYKCCKHDLNIDISKVIVKPNQTATNSTADSEKESLSIENEVKSIDTKDIQINKTPEYNMKKKILFKNKSCQSYNKTTSKKNQVYLSTKKKSDKVVLNKNAKLLQKKNLDRVQMNLANNEQSRQIRKNSRDEDYTDQAENCYKSSKKDADNICMLNNFLDLFQNDEKHSTFSSNFIDDHTENNYDNCAEHIDNKNLFNHPFKVLDINNGSGSKLEKRSYYDSINKESPDYDFGSLMAYDSKYSLSKSCLSNIVEEGSLDEILKSDYFDDLMYSDISIFKANSCNENLLNHIGSSEFNDINSQNQCEYNMQSNNQIQKHCSDWVNNTYHFINEPKEMIKYYAAPKL